MFEKAISRCFRSSPISSPWNTRGFIGRPQRVIPASKKDDELDFAERLYSFLFGKEALEDPAPFGRKRITPEKKVQLEPATTTKFAQPMSEDSSEVQLFRPLLANTRLECTELREAYNASVHGWNYDAFHRCVDGFGAGVVLARAQDGSLFGGFNPRGWISLGENRDSNAAFLFTWPDGDTTRPAIKLPKVGGPGLAVIDKASFGIQFGAEGLTIGLVPGDGPENARSRLGTYYERFPDGTRTLFSSPVKSIKLTDLRVFVAQGKGEEWELDGVVWKTKWKED